MPIDDNFVVESHPVNVLSYSYKTEWGVKMKDFKRQFSIMPKSIQDNKDRKKFSFSSGEKIRINACSDECTESKNKLESFFESISNGKMLSDGNAAYEINLLIDSSHFVKNDSEAYRIESTKDKTVICAYDAGGLYYAQMTFSEMVYTEDDCLFIPCVEIEDRPSFKTRGVYLENRFGCEFLTLDDYKNIIDYFSDMKLNSITLGIHGCWGIQYDMELSEFLLVPIEGYPDIKTPKKIRYYSEKEKKYIKRDNLLPYMFEQDFFGDVIAYAKQKNITVRPLFNCLGHNSLIPRNIPEISAKYEDGGSKDYCFCTSNPKTYEIVFEIFDNIIDRYLKPNGIDSIHLGLDEVGPCENVDKADIKKAVLPNCMCEECRGIELAEQILGYIIKLCRHLKDKGMKSIYVYYDMLYEHFGIDDKLYELFENEGLSDVVVFDWWQYESEPKMSANLKKGINSKFRSVIKPMTGYYHWTIPTASNQNIYDMLTLAYKNNFEGVDAYSTYERCYDLNFKFLSELSWNADCPVSKEEYTRRYAEKYYGNSFEEATVALLSILDAMDEDLTENYMLLKFEYYFHTRIMEGFDIPRDFPGEVYTMLYDEEEKYLPYLKSVREKANLAKSFFEGNDEAPKSINNIWLLTSSHYSVTSDEYISLFEIWNEYKKNDKTKDDVISVLKRLIRQREKLMEMAENIREKSTGYMYLRNMSVMRQYMIDLKNYLEEENNKCLCFELTNFTAICSNYMKFLR